MKNSRDKMYKLSNVGIILSVCLAVLALLLTIFGRLTFQACVISVVAFLLLSLLFWILRSNIEGGGGESSKQVKPDEGKNDDGTTPLGNPNAGVNEQVKSNANVDYSSLSREELDKIEQNSLDGAAKAEKEGKIWANAYMNVKGEKQRRNDIGVSAVNRFLG